MTFYFARRRGFSLVEVIIVSAVMMLFFGGILTAFTYVLELSTNSKARLSALTLANERVEYFRSLPYDSVGTIAGIPNGLIPQNSTTTFNNILFYERVLVQYVDDDADGLGAADSNGILADYKQVKVEYSWKLTGATSTIELISNIVPRSIETTAGGGTIRVNVFDAAAAPLAGASVRLLNLTTTSTIDVTRSTDATGVALFAGAPAASNYQIFVTDSGYSTDQTYVSTTSNPSPLIQPISVLESDVSTMSFQIDRLSTVALTAFSSITEGSVINTFSSTGGIATSTRTAVTSGELQLTQSAGIYATSGVAYLTPVTPAPLDEWSLIAVAPDVPTGTSYSVRLFTASSGVYTIIPDSVVPGNAAGLVGRTIDISGVDKALYPSITVGLFLATTNTALTPALEEVAVYYRASAVRRSGLGFSIRSAKTIGIGPVYKNTFSGVTNGTGEFTATNIEWDSYTLLTPGYAVSRICGGNPFAVTPGTSLSFEVATVIPSTNNLRVQIKGLGGEIVPGATVTLTRSGINVTRTTDTCGQAFFSDATLTASSDYTLNVSAAGYVTANVSPVSIGGDSNTDVTLTN